MSYTEKDIDDYLKAQEDPRTTWARNLWAAFLASPHPGTRQ